MFIIISILLLFSTTNSLPRPQQQIQKNSRVSLPLISIDSQLIELLRSIYGNKVTPQAIIVIPNSNSFQSHLQGENHENHPTTKTNPAISPIEIAQLSIAELPKSTSTLNLSADHPSENAEVSRTSNIHSFSPHENKLPSTALHTRPFLIQGIPFIYEIGNTKSHSGSINDNLNFHPLPDKTSPARKIDAAFTTNEQSPSQTRQDLKDTHHTKEDPIKFDEVANSVAKSLSGFSKIQQTEQNAPTKSNKQSDFFDSLKEISDKNIKNFSTKSDTLVNSFFNSTASLTNVDYIDELLQEIDDALVEDPIIGKELLSKPRRKEEENSKRIHENIITGITKHDEIKSQDIIKNSSAVESSNPTPKTTSTTEAKKVESTTAEEPFLLEMKGGLQSPSIIETQIQHTLPLKRKEEFATTTLETTNESSSTPKSKEINLEKIIPTEMTHRISQNNKPSMTDKTKESSITSNIEEVTNLEIKDHNDMIADERAQENVQPTTETIDSVQTTNKSTDMPKIEKMTDFGIKNNSVTIEDDRLQENISPTTETNALPQKIITKETSHTFNPEKLTQLKIKDDNGIITTISTVQTTKESSSVPMHKKDTHLKMNDHNTIIEDEPIQENVNFTVQTSTTPARQMTEESPATPKIDKMNIMEIKDHVMIQNDKVEENITFTEETAKISAIETLNKTSNLPNPETIIQVEMQIQNSIIENDKLQENIASIGERSSIPRIEIIHKSSNIPKPQKINFIDFNDHNIMILEASPQENLQFSAKTSTMQAMKTRSNIPNPEKINLSENNHNIQIEDSTAKETVHPTSKIPTLETAKENSTTPEPQSFTPPGMEKHTSVAADINSKIIPTTEGLTDNIESTAESIKTESPHEKITNISPLNLDFIKMSHKPNSKTEGSNSTKMNDVLSLSDGSKIKIEGSSRSHTGEHKIITNNNKLDITGNNLNTKKVLQNIIPTMEIPSNNKIEFNISDIKSVESKRKMKQKITPEITPKSETIKVIGSMKTTLTADSITARKVSADSKPEIVTDIILETVIGNDDGKMTENISSSKILEVASENTTPDGDILGTDSLTNNIAIQVMQKESFNTGKEKNISNDQQMDRMLKEKSPPSFNLSKDTINQEKVRNKPIAVQIAEIPTQSINSDAEFEKTDMLAEEILEEGTATEDINERKLTAVKPSTIDVSHDLEQSNQALDKILQPQTLVKPSEKHFQRTVISNTQAEIKHPQNKNSNMITVTKQQKETHNKDKQVSLDQNDSQLDSVLLVPMIKSPKKKPENENHAQIENKNVNEKILPRLKTEAQILTKDININSESIKAIRSESDTQTLLKGTPTDHEDEVKLLENRTQEEKILEGLEKEREILAKEDFGSKFKTGKSIQNEAENQSILKESSTHPKNDSKLLKKFPDSANIPNRKVEPVRITNLNEGQLHKEFFDGLFAFRNRMRTRRPFTERSEVRVPIPRLIRLDADRPTLSDSNPQNQPIKSVTNEASPIKVQKTRPLSFKIAQILNRKLKEEIFDKPKIIETTTNISPSIITVPDTLPSSINVSDTLAPSINMPDTLSSQLNPKEQPNKAEIDLIKHLNNTNNNMVKALNKKINGNKNLDLQTDKFEEHLKTTTPASQFLEMEILTESPSITSANEENTLNNNMNTEKESSNVTNNSIDFIQDFMEAIMNQQTPTTFSPMTLDYEEFPNDTSTVHIIPDKILNESKPIIDIQPQDYSENTTLYSTATTVEKGDTKETTLSHNQELTDLIDDSLSLQDYEAILLDYDSIIPETEMASQMKELEEMPPLIQSNSTTTPTILKTLPNELDTPNDTLGPPIKDTLLEQTNIELPTIPTEESNIIGKSDNKTEIATTFAKNKKMGTEEPKKHIIIEHHPIKVSLEQNGKMSKNLIGNVNDMKKTPSKMPDQTKTNTEELLTVGIIDKPHIPAKDISQTMDANQKMPSKDEFPLKNDVKHTSESSDLVNKTENVIDLIEHSNLNIKSEIQSLNQNTDLNSELKLGLEKNPALINLLRQSSILPFRKVVAVSENEKESVVKIGDTNIKFSIAVMNEKGIPKSLLNGNEKQLVNKIPSSTLDHRKLPVSGNIATNKDYEFLDLLEYDEILYSDYELPIFTTSNTTLPETTTIINENSMNKTSVDAKMIENKTISESSMLEAESMPTEQPEILSTIEQVDISTITLPTVGHVPEKLPGEVASHSIDITIPFLSTLQVTDITTEQPETFQTTLREVEISTNAEIIPEGVEESTSLPIIDVTTNKMEKITKQNLEKVTVLLQTTVMPDTTTPSPAVVSKIEQIRANLRRKQFKNRPNVKSVKRPSVNFFRGRSSAHLRKTPGLRLHRFNQNNKTTNDKSKSKSKSLENNPQLKGREITEKVSSITDKHKPIKSSHDIPVQSKNSPRDKKQPEIGTVSVIKGDLNTKDELPNKTIEKTTNTENQKHVAEDILDRLLSNLLSPILTENKTENITTTIKISELNIKEEGKRTTKSNIKPNVDVSPRIRNEQNAPTPLRVRTTNNAFPIRKNRPGIRRRLRGRKKNSNRRKWRRPGIRRSRILNHDSNKKTRKIQDDNSSINKESGLISNTPTKEEDITNSITQRKEDKKLHEESINDNIPAIIINKLRELPQNTEEGRAIKTEDKRHEHPPISTAKFLINSGSTLNDEGPPQTVQTSKNSHKLGHELPPIISVSRSISIGPPIIHSERNLQKSQAGTRISTKVTSSISFDNIMKNLQNRNEKLVNRKQLQLQPRRITTSIPLQPPLGQTRKIPLPLKENKDRKVSLADMLNKSKSQPEEKNNVQNNPQQRAIVFERFPIER